MKSKFTWILTLFLVFALQAFAQEKTVSGIVSDAAYGDPIPGASVIIVGTDFGTETDMEGRYSLKVKPGDRILVKFTGFKDATATVGGGNVLNIAMAEEEIGEQLVDVVIDVYRTTAKPKSAVAASTITSKTIEGRPNASFMQTLQGQVPGLSIATGSGQPGASSTAILRGAGSINGAIEPLYVIDGVPMSSDRFRSINPNDIDNVTVLKDAGATAIYGNRGANGVIVVTTKRASFNSNLEVKYVGTTSMSTLQDNHYNLMNAREYRTFQQQLNTRHGIGQRVSDRQIAEAVDGNWVDVFFRDAIAQNHTLSFSAGSQNLSSYTSVGFSDMEGTLYNTGLKRFNFRNNLSGKNNNGRLTYGTSISANYSKNEQATNAGSAAVYQNVFMGAFQSMPHLTPDMYDGTVDGLLGINRTYGLGGMPLFLMDKVANSLMVQNEFKFIANGNVNYMLDDNWSVGTNVGVDHQTINQFDYETPNSFLQYARYPNYEYRGSISDINESRTIITSTSNLRWSKIFADKHEVKLGGYIEYIKGHFRSANISKVGFDPIFWSSGAATGWIDDVQEHDFYVPTAGVSIQNTGLFSYFGTADYDYDTRYGVSLTLRRDASFRFVDDNKWGTFWSASARWNINNEKFMQGSIFNDLKIRASYGSAGNQDINNVGWFGSAYLYNTRYSSVSGYNQQPGLALSGLPNRDLRWETITTANAGIDFALWSNRLRGSVDVYQKQTDDLYQSVPLSAINATSGMSMNYGSLRNRGVELIIAGDVVKNDNFRLTLNVNGSYNKNEIMDLPNAEGTVWNGGLTGMRNGGKVSEFYLYQYAGVNSQNGETLYVAADGSLTENPTDADRQWTDKNYLPVYQGAFGFDMEYKGFFASASFTFAKDVWRYDNDYFFFTQVLGSVGIANISKDVLDYWTPQNTGASFPSVQASNLNHMGNSDFYLRDASYVRLRYATIGYNFNRKDLAFMKLTGLRVYAQGENLFTFTKWKGWDAESNRGVDLGQYPTPKTFSFGVEVQF